MKTNIPLIRQFLQAESFQSGVYSTSVLGEWMTTTKGGSFKMKNLESTMAGTVFTVNVAVGEEVVCRTSGNGARIYENGDSN